MHFGKVSSVQPKILSADKVDIEVDLSRGLHSFVLIGLGDRAIEESKDRVSSAIKNSGFISPKQQNQKITMSLAPANLKKTGTNFDVPIAIAYLLASEQISAETHNKIFIGELSLDGKLRKTKGVLSSIIFAKKQGFEEIFIPKENEREASLVEGIKIFCAKNLKEITEHIKTKNPQKIPPLIFCKDFYQKKISDEQKNNTFDQIAGNENAKRGLAIACAGGHNIALYGPPGTGKTMLAKSAAEILPNLSDKQIIECSSIYSSFDYLKDFIIKPPFRSPHHTASYVSIIGGGANLKIGEITLAHNGILFLDELPEFDRRTIDSLRQPMEDRYITISRASGHEKFPANFVLITSMNPCPCGYYKSESKRCICDRSTIRRYQKKISGPIIDRIDIWIKVSKIDYKKISNTKPDSNWSVAKISSQIISARKIQISRAEKLNNLLTNEEIKKYCKLDESTKKLLENMAEKMRVSVRGYFKLLKMARTIADIEFSKDIKESHVLESLQYRPVDLKQE